MKDTTLAYLVAGRTLDTYVVTHEALPRLREVCAAVPDLALVVASYLLPDMTTGPLYARVAIGFVAVRVQSEYAAGITADPFAIDRAQVDAALARVRALDPAVWTRIAAAVPPTQFTAAAMRASLPQTLASAYAGVAFDGPDLAASPDRIHLVASGPLAGGVLARGELRVLPVDEDDQLVEDLDRDAWVYHGGNNEQPKCGVFGAVVARTHIEDLGTIALSPEQLEGDVFLLAVYD